MDITFGVHTAPANTTTDELRTLWTRIEELPFEWISIWDHFYAADGTSTRCFEGIAPTRRWPCTLPGSDAVRSCTARDTATRPCWPTLWPRSTTSAAGAARSAWAQVGTNRSTTPTASSSDRPAIAWTALAEYAAALKALLTGAPVDHEGKYFRLDGATCDPAPLRRPMPLWIGGGGEKRTLAIAAAHADGWNVPFIDPDIYRRKNEVLDGHCAAISRDPSEVVRSVNVGVAPTRSHLPGSSG
ncbi:MAG: LLM class flavin-dependent oxidoreductase [Microthrixaceae bacterium]|nr:LLM class flavin-dependent oxidoreductase [Microthrixaceae bacterium]